MSVTYITIQTRRPSKDGKDSGAIEEGWFTVAADGVQLTDRDGNALPGEENKSQIRSKETAREVAVRLLRAKTWRRPSRPFNRPLRYPKTGWA